MHSVRIRLINWSALYTQDPTTVIQHVKDRVHVHHILHHGRLFVLLVHGLLLLLLLLFLWSVLLCLLLGRWIISCRTQHVGYRLSAQ